MAYDHCEDCKKCGKNTCGNCPDCSCFESINNQEE